MVNRTGIKGGREGLGFRGWCETVGAVGLAVGGIAVGVGMILIMIMLATQMNQRVYTDFDGRVSTLEAQVVMLDNMVSDNYGAGNEEYR